MGHQGLYFKLIEQPTRKAYLKHCPTCDSWKDKADGFHRSAAAPDGRYPNCKVCVKIRDAKRNGKTT